MSSELEMRLPGDDVRLALRAAEKLVSVLEELDRGAGPRPASHRPTFRPTSARTGSLVVAIAPNKPSDAWIFDRLVEGIESVRDRAIVPLGWTKTAAKAIADVARLFGPDAAPELKLTAAAQTRTVTVSRDVGDNLISALSMRQITIGSVTGKLDSITVHRRKVAYLWVEGGGRVEVQFANEQLAEIKKAIGDRVAVGGKLIRNGNGDLVSVSVRSIRVLPTRETAPPLTDLIGIDPDFTGEMTTVEYLRELRGAA